MTKKFKSGYDKPTRVTLDTGSQSHVKQSFKDECDINRIMAKHQSTGLLDHVSQYKGQYGDFTTVQDYQTSLNQVIDAQAAFDTLPSLLRKRFNNDPGTFVDFVSDPDNVEEMVKLGLAVENVSESTDSTESAVPNPADVPSPTSTDSE